MVENDEDLRIHVPPSIRVSLFENHHVRALDTIRSKPKAGMRSFHKEARWEAALIS